MRRCLNDIKSRKSRHVQAIEESPAFHHATVFEADFLRVEGFRQALRKLTPEERICINLLFLEGLSSRKSFKSRTGSPR